MPTAINGASEAVPGPNSSAAQPASRVAEAVPSVLEVLKAFQETQERRVAHWQEYDEALDAFMAQEASSGGAGGRGGPVGGSRNEAGVIRTGEAAEGNGLRCCGHGATEGVSGADQEGEAASAAPAPPVTEELMSRIMGLVTSGLLDCGHTTRALSSELKAGNSRFPPRADLATMLGAVQELENRLLRAVVRRDQARRRERIEGRDLENEILDAKREIEACKREIGEAMEEVSAEVAEIVAAEE